MRWRVSLAVLPALALAFATAPVRACTPSFSQPTQEQERQWVRDQVSDAPRIVDVTVTGPIPENGRGRATIIAVLKGKARVGQSLRVYSQDSAACGPGRFRGGERVVLLLGRSKPYYLGSSIPREYLEFLGREGLISARR